MTSLHIWKGIEKASRNGGYAGRSETVDVWELSKRELVEIALRLGELCSDEGGFDGALQRVREERRILSEQNII